MEIKNMNKQELIEKRNAISAELEGDVSLERLTELETTIQEIDLREKEIESIVEKRSQLVNEVKVKGKVVESRKGETKMNEEKTYNLESPEYRSAFFKKLAGVPLTEVEERAHVETTATFGGGMPKETANRIWSNIQRDHSLLSDINVYELGALFEVSIATTVVEGKAKKVAEGVANDKDLKITFTKKTLSGNDYSAHAEISYAMGTMNGQALEDFLVEEIHEQLGDALADDLVAELALRIHSTNKVTLAEVSFEEFAKLLGKVKQKGEIKVYLNNESLYSNVVSLVDLQGRPIFQPNAQIAAEGAFIGATLRKESAVPSNKIYIGVPKAVTGNFVTTPMIERDKEIKTHKHIFAGYCRFEAALKNDLAFVEVTITPAGA